MLLPALICFLLNCLLPDLGVDITIYRTIRLIKYFSVIKKSDVFSTKSVKIKLGDSKYFFFSQNRNRKILSHHEFPGLNETV